MRGYTIPPTWARVGCGTRARRPETDRRRLLLIWETTPDRWWGQFSPWPLPAQGLGRPGPRSGTAGLVHSTNTHSTNTHSTNTHSTNTHRTNTRSTNTRRTNIHSTNTHSTNTHRTNTHSTNIHSTNTHSTNTHKIVWCDL